MYKSLALIYAQLKLTFILFVSPNAAVKTAPRNICIHSCYLNEQDNGIV